MALIPMEYEGGVETGTITSSYTKAFEGLYKYGKVVNCTFQLSGVTTSGTFANIATIPVGFRPKNFIAINGCRGDNAGTRITVFPNGNITMAAQLSNENLFVSACWIID